MAGNPLYATPQWRQLRLAILARDQHRCRIQGPRCTTTATEADHIIELDAGGAPLDPANLQAACKRCNSSKGTRYVNAKRGRSEPSGSNERHSPGWG